MYNELGHYFLVLSIFVTLTYDKRPAAVSLYFLLSTTSFFGILFCYISSDFSNYNVFTNSNANAPLFYKISGTWSNHEGSLLLWCWILSLYGFFLGYRVRRCNVSKRGRSKNIFFFCKPLVAFCFAPLMKRENKRFRRHLLLGTINHKSSQSKTTAPSGLVQESSHKRSENGANAKKNKRPIRLKKWKEFEKKKSRFFFLLYVLCNNLDSLSSAQSANDKVSFIDERRIYMGIALFFSIFLSVSSNPFVRISFVCTKSLAELNPVLQDPILAIHPPCIYAGYVASAIAFCLCLSKIMNAIPALYLPKQRDSKAGNNKMLDAFLFRITNELMTQENAKKIIKNIFENPGSLHLSSASISLRNRSLLLLQYLAALPLPWPKERLDLMRSEWTKRIIRKKNTAFLHFGWTRGANKVVSNPEYHGWKQIQIWILTCWFFLTVGILLGSWWAYHESGRGGWWFWDPVENASFMPWILATACIHSVILPKSNYWTLFLNMITFLCRVLGTFFVRSGLLASVHSFATDSTRGIFLWFFFLSISSISLMFFFQMKQQLRLVGALFDLSSNQGLTAPKAVNEILWYSRRSIHSPRFTRLLKLIEGEEGHDEVIGYKASRMHRESSSRRDRKIA
uniref:Cytochrome c biogenesis factor N n=1 Tax=Buxbaumia aphylla TaxID=70128 RepID=A0A075BMZ3_BUXAP|nr:cytochrome c biogenesis factor N [Buxbaumia aphylla]AGN74249.1 cytochrome c biogenesis factor N [Buxbaumia aphylla]AHI16003.1 cytochrome c biogenesis factor N [Buxbaumia aphylla]